MIREGLVYHGQGADEKPDPGERRYPRPRKGAVFEEVEVSRVDALRQWRAGDNRRRRRPDINVDPASSPYSTCHTFSKPRQTTYPGGMREARRGPPCIIIQTRGQK